MDKNRRRIRIGYIQWLLIYTYICTIFSFTCEAANAQDRTGNEEYVLILNSYNESSPWSNSITTPIVHKLAGTKNIDAYIEHLNLFMVGDSAKIEKVFRNTFLKIWLHPSPSIGICRKHESDFQRRDTSFMGYRTYYCLRGRPLCVS